MTTGYKSYRVEIKNVKFTADDGRICPKTAIVTFVDHEGKDMDTELLGAIDVNSIYEMIKEGKPVNLDNFYVSDFSLSFYRRHNDLEKKTHVPVNGFSARNTFFESKICNDFSFASFADGEVSFDGAHFAKAFTGSVFGKGNVIFSNTYFGDGNLKFTGASFGEGDFLFKNSIVKDGIKDFQDIQFGNG
jgi:hypothetical protein